MDHGKIICVDDDINTLAGFHRNLRKKFDVTNCLSGPAALKVLQEKGPFAVILSDMCMPGMGGLEFLARAHEISPESVQVVLSGAADLNTAIQATNSGRVFRFLMKPCSQESLTATLQAALDQHALRTRHSEMLASFHDPELRALGERARRSAVEMETHAGQAPSRAEEMVPFDTVTRRASIADEAAVQALTESANGAAAGVFTITGLDHVRSRYGEAVVGQLAHYVGRSVASRLTPIWNAEGVFLWHGECVVVLAKPSAGLRELHYEAKNLVTAPISFHFETETRSAVIPVRLTSSVVTGGEGVNLAVQLEEATRKRFSTAALVRIR